MSSIICCWIHFLRSLFEICLPSFISWPAFDTIFQVVMFTSLISGVYSKVEIQVLIQSFVTYRRLCVDWDKKLHLEILIELLALLHRRLIIYKVRCRKIGRMRRRWDPVEETEDPRKKYLPKFRNELLPLPLGRWNRGTMVSVKVWKMEVLVLYKAQEAIRLIAKARKEMLKEARLFGNIKALWVTHLFLFTLHFNVSLLVSLASIFTFLNFYLSNFHVTKNQSQII